jgi:hypothetical protein
MVTHSQLCELVAQSYRVPATWQAGNFVRAVGTKIGDEFVVAVPGTVNLAQWMIDFSIWPKPFPYIGTYHEGFGLWGLKLAELVLKDLPAHGRIVFSGHSLGAQLAQVLAAVFASLRGRTAPMRVVTFGCPRGAFMGNLTAGSLVRSALEAVSYRNAGDPICEVPPLPLWKHNVSLTEIGAPVHALAPSMFDHSITLYGSNVRAVEKLSSMQRQKERQPRRRLDLDVV